MAGSLFSAQWYRVTGLRPLLRSHAQIHRHQYRGQTWYVLQDLSSERLHRFSPAAHFVIGLMDGRRTVQEIWDLATTRLGDDAPTQDEMIHLLSQLHASDVLQCDVPPDTAELLERHQRQERRLWRTRLLSPFAWRFPLFDPERFLRACLPIVRPLLGWAGALVWVGVVGPAFVLAVSHWSDLTQDIIDRALAPHNLVLLWLLFPLLKALHEFGHAFAVKAFGGEVHDMGVMILVLTPLPYVDASSASAFREKWQRTLVGAAGMLVELFVAAAALFVWLNAEPGALRAVCYNTLLIAGVSTLLFNGNPLLRFDGYYILGDLIEIPNLRPRSNAYVGYLCERYLFGRRDAEPPEAQPGERAWLLGYAVASFAYRAFVAIAIILFIAGKFFVLGVILAALAAVTWVVVPAARGVSHLLTSPGLRQVRSRAVGVTAAAVGALLGLTCLVPAPLRTRAEGVIWIPDEALVRAGADGFIERVVGQPGARVSPGDILIECRDPALSAQVGALAARLQELQARHTDERARDVVRAQIVKEELVYVERSLARSRQRETELTLRSRAAGTFVLPRAEDLPGRFARQGDVLGYVVELTSITVRTVVAQADIDLIRQRGRRVQVRLAEHPSKTLPAHIRRMVPSATQELPSTALGSQGGGEIPTDPADAQGAKAFEKFFQIDLELPVRSGVVNVGGRVHVRFDHGWEPLAAQAYRRARQVFLSRFNV